MAFGKNIIKDSTSMTVSTIVAQFIGMFTSILMRKYMTPEMMGVWATCTVILSYAAFSDLGLFAAAEVKIPFLKGKGELKEVERLRNTVFTFALYIALLVITLFWAASFLFMKHIAAPFVIGVRMVALIVAATLFYNLYIVMLRADKNFSLLAKSVVFNAAVTLASVGTLVYYFKLNGLFASTLLATFTSWLYIKYHSSYSLRPHFTMRDAARLMGTGMPLIMVGLLYTLLLSVDKIAIVKMIGARELGFYSIALLGLTYTHSFPKLFGIVLFPSMQEEFGKSNSKERLLEVVGHSAFVMAYLFPLLLVAAYFIIPLIVYALLPRYIPGVNSMKLLLGGCYFLSLAPLAQNFIISMGKQVALAPMLLLAAATGAACNYFAIKAGYSINGVAVGTSVAYAIYFICVYVYSFNHSFAPTYIFKLLLKLSLPFIYSVSILIAMEVYLRNGSLIVTTGIQAGLFLLSYLPMLLFLQKKSGVLTHLKKIIKPVSTEGVLEYEA